MFKIQKMKWPSIVIGGLIALMLVMTGVGSIPGLGEPKATPVNDKDLVSFVEVNKRMFKIQSEAEKEMVKVIQDHGMTVDRFVEITTAKDNTEKAKMASKDELAKMSKVSEKVDALNQKLQEKGLAVIKELGLTPQKYEEIANTLQNSPESQKKYNEMMTEKQG